MTSQEGNTLIADFMGWVKHPDPAYHEHEMATKLKYHSSWDWLMPVVEKIEALRVNDKEDADDVEWQFSVEIINYGCVIHRDVLPQYHGTTEDFLSLYDCRKTNKLKSTYEAVTKFIQWYNTQPK